MNETDTPRTDGEYWHRHSDCCCPDGCNVVPMDFARKLERELNDANLMLKIFKASIETGLWPERGGGCWKKLVEILEKEL